MREIEIRSVTLVLGGVRSGKSRYAQHLAERSGRVTFVATAECRDDEEMRVRIAQHRAQRPKCWATIEEPLDLGGVMQSAADGCDLLLIDCLTLFAANILEAHGEDAERLQSRIDAFCFALKTVPSSVVVVSSEVGSGIVPAFALGRRYRDLVGEINQRVAALADNVLLMVAGLPLALKGSVNTVPA
jgi:adenosylcobinamide kinase / adenosylcobinamide-phosphate guanylyltransferase